MLVFELATGWWRGDDVADDEDDGGGGGGGTVSRAKGVKEDDEDA